VWLLPALLVVQLLFGHCGAAVACRQRKANATAGNAGQLALIPSIDPLC